MQTCKEALLHRKIIISIKMLISARTYSNNGSRSSRSSNISSSSFRTRHGCVSSRISLSSLSSSSAESDDAIERYDKSLETIVPDVTRMTDMEIATTKGTQLNVRRRFRVSVKTIVREEEEEGEEKSVQKYCKLPANQYNVIDAQRVKMEEDGSFTVSTGTQKFLFLTVDCSGRVRIEETETGVKQTLEKAEIIDASEGNKNKKIVDAMNESIGCVRVVNTVAATRIGDEDFIESQLEFSGEFTNGVFAKIGPRLNEIAQFVLGATLPYFLQTIGRDYELWSTGGKREMAKMDVGSMASTILKGAKGKMPKGVTEIDVV